MRSTGGVWDGAQGGDFTVWVPVGYDPKERIPERIQIFVDKLKERRVAQLAFQEEIRKTLAALEKPD